jgi:hypothetical protein
MFLYAPIRKLKGKVENTVNSCRVMMASIPHCLSLNRICRLALRANSQFATPDSRQGAFIRDMQSRKPTAGQAREHWVRKSIKDSGEHG